MRSAITTFEPESSSANCSSSLFCHAFRGTHTAPIEMPELVTIEDIDQVPGHLATFDTASNSYRFPIPPGANPATNFYKLNPTWGSIRSTEWNGHSIYHALQVNFTQRPVKGLSYQIAYTWQKSIDAGSNTFSEGGESANRGYWNPVGIGRHDAFHRGKRFNRILRPVLVF